MDEMIFKSKNGDLHVGKVVPYLMQTEAEVAQIPTSTHAQAVIILGDGSGLKIKFRLPGGSWTEG